MKFSRARVVRAVVLVSATALVGAFGLPGGVGVASAGAPDYDCKAGAVVIVAGTNDADARSQIGVEQRYTGKHPNGAANPSSPYHGDGEYRVIKPEYPTTLWPLGTVGYNDDVALGVAATKQAIVEYQANCPEEEVVVVGYSQGARVAGDVLSDLANGRLDDEEFTVDGHEGTHTLSKENVRGELYSDPRQEGSMAGRGIELALIGVIPGLTMTGPRPGGFGDVPVITYCYRGDPICDLPDLLHDPFGAIDGLIGYFTKHGYYPWRMWAPVSDGSQWKCLDAPAPADPSTSYHCLVDAPSAISGVRQDVVNAVRGLVGLPPREVIDFWGMIPNLNRIFPHATLSDLQPYLAPVMNLFPPLPQLGYGAYLPDLFVFTAFLEGLTSLDLKKMGQSVEDLAKSLVSIALLPVSFTKHWVSQAVMLAGRDGPSGPSETPGDGAAAFAAADAHLAEGRAGPVTSAPEEGRRPQGIEPAVTARPDGVDGTDGIVPAPSAPTSDVEGDDPVPNVAVPSVAPPAPEEDAAVEQDAAPAEEASPTAGPGREAEPDSAAEPEPVAAG
ncbi:cutinase family protein [Gordonia iterans]